MKKKFYSSGLQTTPIHIGTVKELKQELNSLREGEELYEFELEHGTGVRVCCAEQHTVDYGMCGKDECGWYDPLNGKNGPCSQLSDPVVPTGRFWRKINGFTSEMRLASKKEEKIIDGMAAYKSLYLKPCPFCGKTPEMERYSKPEGYDYSVKCGDKCWTEQFSRSAKEAADKWNKRVGDDTPWPISSCIEELCRAADILIYEKDYDGEGYEKISKARMAADMYSRM